MNISQAARDSGLTAKALRYYESLDLVVPARCANGYRDYTERDLQALRFIRRARATGFAVEEVRELLELYRDPARRSRDAKQLVEEKLQHIEAQLHTLEQMRDTLQALSSHCAGDDSPQCAILDGLSRRDPR